MSLNSNDKHWEWQLELSAAEERCKTWTKGGGVFRRCSNGLTHSSTILVTLIKVSITVGGYSKEKKTNKKHLFSADRPFWLSEGHPPSRRLQNEMPDYGHHALNDVTWQPRLMLASTSSECRGNQRPWSYQFLFFQYIFFSFTEPK